MEPDVDDLASRGERAVVCHEVYDIMSIMAVRKGDDCDIVAKPTGHEGE